MGRSPCFRVVRTTIVACLLAVGCSPASSRLRTTAVELPKMRPEPAPELSPPGLPAVVVAELGTPEREVRFARNGIHALLATRSGGQWLVGPVRVDRDDETAVSPSPNGGGLRPVHAAAENTPAALHRQGTGFLLAWVEHTASTEDRVMALALDHDGKARGAARLIGQSNQSVDWIDVLGEGGATFIVWDAQRGAKRSIDVAAWSESSLQVAAQAGATAPPASPSVTLEGGRGWHAVAATDTLWFASVDEGTGGAGSVSVDRVVASGGKLAVVHRVVSATKSALGDVQLAALNQGALVAWSDRRDGDLHVYTASVGVDGQASEPNALDRLGARALVGITASGDRTRAMIAWENVSTRAAQPRIVGLATLLPNGSKGDARGELVFQSATDTPQVFADGAGFGVLTLAPVQLAREAASLVAPAGPTFVRLDAELRVRSSEPLRIPAFSDAEPLPGLPMFVQSAECADDRCTVVARGGGAPSLLALVNVPVRDHGWSPAARRLPPLEPPLADELTTLTELDHPVADFAAAELADGRTILAWVERVAAANVTEKSGARLQLRFVEKDGKLGEIITLSEKAVPAGGIDIEALPAGSDAVAAVAWVGPVQGPQFFVTRIGPRGEKVLQKTVTKIARSVPVPKNGVPMIPNEVLDVDLTSDERGGLFCAWSDSRTGDAEIFLARLDARLDRRGNEVQLTTTKGASTEPQLVLVGDKTLVAWSETGDGRDQGDIHLATLETASMRIIDRGREIAHSAGHSRTPGFANAPAGAVLWWLDEPTRLVAGAPNHTDSDAGGDASDDVPGLRVLSLDAQGQPLAQLKRLGLENDAPNSMALRCEDGSCRGVLVSLDGGDLRLDAVTTPFASGAPLRRSRLVGLSDGNHDDVRVSVTGHGNHAYFAEEHDGRTRLRKLTLRWSR